MNVAITRTFTIDHEKLDFLFPFYFAFNDRLKLIREGEAIKKLLPSLRIRKKVSAYFELEKEIDSSNFFNNIEENTEIILNIQFSQVKLKGTFLKQNEDNITYFFGNPLLNQIDEINKLKLDKSDFAHHDTGIDQLYRYHANDNSVKKLSEQKQNLHKTNTQLSQEIKQTLDLLKQGFQELSGPIRNNITYTNLIKKSRALDEDLHKSLEFLEMGSIKANKLLEALKTYFLFQEQRKNVENTEIDLAIASVQDHLKQLIQAKNATIKFSCNSMARIDFRHLKFLLQSLVENAIYFNDSVRPEVYIQCTKEGKYWQCSVEDNGIGIANHLKKDVFEPFTRFNTKLYNGIGMSLATCKTLVELYNGEIWIEPAKEKGSRVCFSILEK